MSSSGIYLAHWQALKRDREIRMDCHGIPVSKVIRAISKEKNEDIDKDVKDQISSKQEVDPKTGKKILVLKLRKVSKTRLKYLKEAALGFDEEVQLEKENAK